MGSDVTFDRPVKGKLVVLLDNGDKWDATDEDLARFGLAKKHDLYMRAHDMWLEALGVEDSDELPDVANCVRYVMECAIVYDHSPWARADGTPWSEEDGGERVRELLRAVLTGDRETVVLPLKAAQRALRLLRALDTSEPWDVEEHIETISALMEAIGDK